MALVQSLAAPDAPKTAAVAIPAWNADTPASRRWHDDAAPKVSIIILNFNRAHLTVQCLASLAEHTTGHAYEIIVVDNGSTAEDFMRLAASHGRAKVIRLEANRFFGEGNNIGAEAARGEFLIFMNNDVTVNEGWLEPLIAAFAEHADCGVSGPKFVYPDGRLQEAGALIDKEGFAVQLGKFGDPKDPRFNEPRIVDYVSAATAVMRRSVFMDVLGFDLMWEPAYYEDSDLCLKIRLLGLQTYYCPSSSVVHHENATSADHGLGMKLNNIVEINRPKFVERWGGFLRGDETQRPDVLHKPNHRQGPAPKRRAALYTPYNIIPGGGERYLLTIAQTLCADYEVSLVTPELFSALRIRTIGRELGLELDDVRPVALRDALAEAPFDLFIAMGNEIVPPTPAMGRKNIYHCQFPFPTSEHELARRWAWWSAYEGVVVNSPFTQSHIRAQMARYGLDERPVSVVYPPVDTVSIDDERLANKELVILHVGRFFANGHCKRQDTLIEAFRDHVLRVGIRAELHLVGSLHPEAEHRDYFLHCQNLARGLPVHFHLNAAPADMKELYRRSSVYWHATGFGVDEMRTPEKTEHFGITIAEAMSAGCIPVVLKKGGPRHIVAHGETGYHFETAAELGAHTVAILKDNNGPEALAMRRASMARAQDFAVRSFAGGWRAVVEEGTVSA